MCLFCLVITVLLKNILGSVWLPWSPHLVPDTNKVCKIHLPWDTLNARVGSHLPIRLLDKNIGKKRKSESRGHTQPLTSTKKETKTERHSLSPQKVQKTKK